MMTTPVEAIAAPAAASRYAHIDALRAISVMLVVVAHAGLDKVVPGGSGVTFFFSISGFIITYLLLKERSRTGGFRASRFYLRRALKIGPPLLVVVIVPTVVYGITHAVSVARFLSQIFFSYNWMLAFGDPAQVLPGSSVVWSLAIEEQFYIVFAVLWLLSVRRPDCLRLLTIGSIGVVVAANLDRIRLALADPAAHENRIYFGSDTRADALAMGVLTAVLYFGWRNGEDRFARLQRFVGSSASVCIAVALFIVSLTIRNLWFRDTFRFSIQSLAACLIILYGFYGMGPGRSVLDRLMQMKMVQAIGRASYSIYLVHFPLAILYSGAISGLPRSASVSCKIAVSVLAGLLLYRVVEVPFERLRARLQD